MLFLKLIIPTYMMTLIYIAFDIKQLKLMFKEVEKKENFGYRVRVYGT
ncbi:hypothetical protein XBKB1_4190099 [Xenorhabdus bovienii str. kraussei Becker Underwood]|uniref:Uncharacterized protein n=1 Tax=Xenorhabdus bovienii str. kraussei Becker Underwood TaxID=1398204 RepID=A0A077Q1G7_XENBV|nr:hypothetical protein XBKB1_4190099 [Xenorhabdus bovienii str. kraussei Becker Underwood]